jgi:DNA-binding transcriptional LysR family regulator
LSEGEFDWNDLRYFLELARQGRLALAAQRLRVDHTTVSRRIRELETALDAKLFVRSQEGFILTDAGQRLLAQAERIESNAMAIGRSMEAKTSHLSGVVRVASMEAFASLYLAGHLTRFKASHPHIEVELVTATYWANLTKREADILISFVQPSGHRLISRKVGEFELRLYASPLYLERHGAPRGIADLGEHFFCNYIDDLVLVDQVRWLAEIISQPRTAFRSTSLVAQYNAALTGMGIALLPSFVAAKDPRLVPLLVGQASVLRDFWLTSHADLEHVARIRATGNFIAELIETNRDFLAGR